MGRLYRCRCRVVVEFNVEARSEAEALDTALYYLGAYVEHLVDEADSEHWGDGAAAREAGCECTPVDEDVML